MPYRQEHAAQIEPQGKYLSFRKNNNSEFGAGISVINGTTKEDVTEIQAIHFSANKFTADEARKWLGDNNKTPLDFFEATGENGEEGEKYWEDDEDDFDDDYDQDDDQDEEDEDDKGKSLNQNGTSIGKIEYKHVLFNVIATKEASINGVKTGIIEGYASTYGNVDRGNDVILKGAFKECLQKYVAEKRPVKMHYQHSMMDIIGGFPPEKFIDDEKGLYCRGEVNLEVQKGREAYALAKQGVLTDLSIGYSIDDCDYSKSATGTPIRVLKKLTLWEVSMVGEPMNPDAKITEVKMSIKDLVKLVRAEKITKKSQLARILRQSKGFTKRAAEYLVSLIHLEDKQVVMQTPAKTNSADDTLVKTLHDLSKTINLATEKRAQDKIIKELQSIKSIIKK